MPALAGQNLLRRQSVLDYGCGSGILAIAAKRLGAGVVSVSSRRRALRASAQNAHCNGVDVPFADPERCRK
jgi:ribosomal protein L11 methyltransferase